MFDSINHTILLKKLEMYGITSPERKWFSLYIVTLEDVNKLSDFTRKRQSSVRSVLGLILFVLFINDICNFAVEGCVLNMYVDDVIIYTSATSKDELECRL